MQPLGFISFLLICGLIYLCTLVAAMMWRLTHPPRRTYSFAVSRGIAGAPDELDPPLPFEQWAFVSRSRTLNVWDMTGRSPAGPAIIFTHGWGDSRIGSLVRAARLADFASRMIAWDLPGHGEAPGICRLGRSEAADLKALIDHLACPVVLYGWSMGAGLSIEAGCDQRVRAVIAEAPYRFQDVPACRVLRAAGLPCGWTLDLALTLLGMSAKSRQQFDRAAHAARLTCPLLVLHGTEDEICPIDDGRAIAAAARHARLVEIEGGDHNGLWIEPAWAKACTQAVRGLLAEVP